MSESVLTLVLAGRRGERLGPLTRTRPKAAVPFGGEYRIIDFALTNCIHSGLRRILVLTQYRSYGLHEHLRNGWGIFNPALDEYISPVPPPMHSGSSGYSGSADALAQNAELIEHSGARHVLILPGTHVYRMDYEPMIQAHIAAGHEVSMACARRKAHALGDGPRVEKGPDSRVRALYRSDEQVNVPDERRVLSAMGIYLMATPLLLDVLAGCRPSGGTAYELAEHVLPHLVGTHDVAVYEFGGKQGRVSQDRFWSPIHSVDEYFKANMSLLEPVPPLDLYQGNWPIWSNPGRHPPARTVSSVSGNEGIFVNSVVSNGTVIAGAAVSESVLSPQCRIEDGATVERSILFSGVRVGAGARVRNCIVDTGMSIEPGDTVGFDSLEDARRFQVSPGGVVVVTSQARSAHAFDPTVRPEHAGIAGAGPA